MDFFNYADEDGWEDYGLDDLSDAKIEIEENMGA